MDSIVSVPVEMVEVTCSDVTDIVAAAMRSNTLSARVPAATGTAEVRPAAPDAGTVACVGTALEVDPTGDVTGDVEVSAPPLTEPQAANATMTGAAAARPIRRRVMPRN